MTTEIDHTTGGYVSYPADAYSFKYSRVWFIIQDISSLERVMKVTKRNRIQNKGEDKWAYHIGQFSEGGVWAEVMEHEIDVVKILSYQPDKVPGDTFDRDVTNPVDGFILKVCIPRALWRNVFESGAVIQCSISAV